MTERRGKQIAEGDKAARPVGHKTASAETDPKRVGSVFLGMVMRVEWQVDQ